MLIILNVIQQTNSVSRNAIATIYHIRSMFIKRKGYITKSSVQVHNNKSNKQLYLSHMIVKQENTDNITYKNSDFSEQK